jgi:phosphodiesterase/alkaline phosphatase D-like protein
MLAAGVPLHTVSELLGHSFVAVTGDVHGHAANQGARSAVQRLSAAMGWENVCRGYTNGYTAAKKPPRICPKRPLTCCFPSG